MDTELLRKKYQQNAIRLELPTDAHLFSIMLHWDHMQNKHRELRVRHDHLRYEVMCLWSPEDPNVQPMFKVVPPHTWHTGRFDQPVSGSYMTTFQFLVKEYKDKPAKGFYTPNAALETFLELDGPVELADTFGGAKKTMEICAELARGGKADVDKLYFLFQGLMIDLAKALPCYVPHEPKAYKYSSDDFRMEVIEVFFAEQHGTPSCCREQLAEILCISDRQLDRVLERLFHQTFFEILTQYRMEYAEAWRMQGLPLQAVAEKVGYKSIKRFLCAYKQYHGREDPDEDRHLL